MADPASFSVQVRADDSSVVIELRGELDMLTAPDFRTCLDAAIEATSGDVVVDLAGVDFIDSSGLTELVAAHRSLRDRGRQLHLDSVAPRVTRVLQISGLDGHFSVRASRPVPA